MASQKKEKKVVIEVASVVAQDVGQNIIQKVQKLGVEASIPCKIAGRYKIRTAPMAEEDAGKAIKALEEAGYNPSII